MKAHCKNCDAEVHGNFCEHCGQKTATHRLAFHDALHELEHGVLHFDRGIFFTLKELWLRPGTAIRNYIDGKRVRYIAPLSIVFILATIYGLLTHFLHIEINAAVVIKSDSDKNVLAAKINEWIGSHFAIITIAALPLQALASFIVFRKQGYNFIEHFVLNAYFSAQRLSWHIAMVPVLYVLHSQELIDQLRGFISITDVLLLMVWGYLPFFNRLTKPKAAALTLLAVVLQFAFILLVVMAVAALAIQMKWIH